MDIGEIARGGLVLVGCGKMGSAMLAGWIARGLPPDRVWVVEPAPSDWLKAQPVHLNTQLPGQPGVIVVAVKPQIMTAALPGFARYGGGRTLVLTIAAGTRIALYESLLGPGTPIVRAMPNTPAAIGRGISALIGNSAAGPASLAAAETLLAAIGQTVRLTDEGDMDAVTAVSGSGPAYVFHLIETLAAAGVGEGLDPDLALQLARATVAGAGALAETSKEPPARLRINVTSPGGTTAAALAVLMDEQTGFPPLLRRAVHAATLRGRELGK